ncbi:17404_t:CDS:2 [Acaulospora morrowiae]|uniref:Ammonium transporter n=1 Tax=Acaulospora morrowiae TaxID=94023 RepID=A0A9N9FC94_9GLOM|nr:17404_t:CDS:2 [Acaulospora morrowiae]
MSSNATSNDSYNNGDVAWVLTSTCLVWLMIPGIAFVYGGMSRRNGALSSLMLCFLAIPIVSIQWILFGYSITFSNTGGRFIGNFKEALFINNLDETISHQSGQYPYYEKIPKLTHAVFQLMFAAITPSIIFGSVSGRIKTIPALIFLFIWSTLVYDFIAYWCWSNNGWLNEWGVLDFAGGTPVHISSGAAALAYCLVVRRNVDIFRPHDATNVILGTVFLWFGWFGFNGGSALGANLRATMACIVTNTAASAGGLTWMFIEYFKEPAENRRLSAVGFCSGALAGLVAITPGSGFVTPYASLIFGLLSGAICKLATEITFYRDENEVFAIHGVGGIIGNILTGVFADQRIAMLNNQIIDGGAIDGNGIQILKQLVSCVVGFSWSFIITVIILFIMSKILDMETTGNNNDDENFVHAAYD